MNDQITTRFDLLDCNMAICSEQIPPLFSDNFDFQTRRHLIREILTNEEVSGFLQENFRTCVDLLASKILWYPGLAFRENRGSWTNSICLKPCFSCLAFSGYLFSFQILAYRMFAHIVEERQALFIGDLTSYITVK